MRLRELLGESVELGKVLQDAGAVAETQPLLAAELLGAVPVLAGTQGLESLVELRELLHEARGAERLLGQCGELRALLRRHRGEHPLGGRGPGSEGVDELLDRLGALGEELSVPFHEVAELLGGVVPPGMCREQVVEVAKHLLDPLAVLRRRVLEGLLHAGEPLVQQLATEEVLDLLVLLAGLPAAPGVVGELGDGRRR